MFYCQVLILFPKLAKICDYHLKLSLHAKLLVKSKRILYCSARGYRPKAASCNIDQRMTRWQKSFSHVVLKLFVTTPHYFLFSKSILTVHGSRKSSESCLLHDLTGKPQLTSLAGLRQRRRKPS